jgi:hypothetical protein
MSSDKPEPGPVGESLSPRPELPAARAWLLEPDEGEMGFAILDAGDGEVVGGSGSCATTSAAPTGPGTMAC